MLEDGDAASSEAPRVPAAAAERQRAGEAGGGRDVDGRVSSSSSSSPPPPIDAPPAPSRPLRALFCTLEFSTDTFSGNGTLAQACVRGLAAAGVDVVVLAARPKTRREEEEQEEEEEAPPPPPACRLHGASALVEVPVPGDLWGRLDARSPWREFRAGASALARAAPLRAPRWGGPPRPPFDVAFAVDWTGVAAAEALFASVAAAGGARGPRIVYLNFRVFSRSAETAAERELVRREEGRAVASAAAASVALCAADADDLSLLSRAEGAAAGGEGGGGRPAVSVLLPPLRREFAEMPPPPREGAGEGGGKENTDSGGGRGGGRGGGGPRRDLLLCCVRLSPEKEPHRFVEVVERLARRGVLSELGVVPALVGGGDSDYADGLRERMRRLGGAGGGGASSGAAALVEAGFVGAAELSSRFFDRALLNFHPCLADAYGMSAVEAGSRGAPSVIHSGGSERGEEEEEEGGVEVDGKGKGGEERRKKVTVGASALLRAEEGESIALDLSLPAEEVAARVEELLRGSEAARDAGDAAAKTTKKKKEKAKTSSLSLREVGERAQRRARSWGERQHGEALAALARRVASSKDL